MANLATLPTFGPGGPINVIVEVPTARFTYDKELGLFAFGNPLSHGVHCPFDRGFIPSTQEQNGDPVRKAPRATDTT